MADENVDIRVRLRERLKFSRDARKTADEVDDIGDAARRASRQLLGMSRTASATRVQFGPLSTTARGGALAIGGLVLMTGRLTPTLLGAAEATAVLAGGAGGAGAVGLTAVAQASVAARLGLGGLMDALGGNETAAKNLSPELRDIFFALKDGQDELRATAQAGLLPGLEKGVRSAKRNLPVLDALVGDTSETLGDLAADAGDMFGSKAWGRDLKTVGGANVAIIGNLGDAGLNLADAFRHVVVEAAPLAAWLSEAAESGSASAEAWAENARASGDMARFFREARTDLRLLASAGGHGSRGLVNLFGSQDVDGTETLRNLDAILGRFERWTTSPAAQAGIGEAIVGEIPEAVAAVMDAVARNMPAAAGTAAKVFWDSFWGSSIEGSALMGAAAFGKLGGFKMLGRKFGLGGGGGLGGGRGSSPGNPLFVVDVAGASGSDWKKKLLPSLVATGKVTGPAAALLGLTLIKDNAAKNHGIRRSTPAHPGLTPTQDVRAEGGTNLALSMDILRLLGIGGGRRGSAPSTMPAPWNMPGPFEPIVEFHHTTRVGDQVIERSVTRKRAKRRARQGR